MLGPEEFTQLLVNWSAGDKSALDAMTPVLYDELHRLARRLLASERPDHTLQATALVNEAYIRLVDQRAVNWENRAHFLGIAASMMRRILINHAKAHRAAKREGFAQAITLDDALGLYTDPWSLLDVDQSLDKLERLDPKQGKVVELRYFGGLSIEETATVMGISEATVKREWKMARLWLIRQMNLPVTP